MGNGPLVGKKIAVVVESQFIPAELNLYQDLFSRHGAEVADGLTPVGTGEGKILQHRRTWRATGNRVDRCFTGFRSGEGREDYAAVVVAANYVSVRLRLV